MHTYVKAGLKLTDLRKIYFEMKEKVFKSQSRVLKEVCDTDALEQLLKKWVGTEHRMSDVKKPKYVDLLITVWV